MAMGHPIPSTFGTTFPIFRQTRNYNMIGFSSSYVPLESIRITIQDSHVAIENCPVDPVSSSLIYLNLPMKIYEKMVIFIDFP